MTTDSGRLPGSRASIEPQERLDPSGFDPERLAANLAPEMIYDLRNVAEGKPTVRGFGSPVWHLKCLGYVEERIFTKPCRTCGTPQHDYSYSKITDAGREVLKAASAIEARRAAATKIDAVADESAVAESQTPNNSRTTP